MATARGTPSRVTFIGAVAAAVAMMSSRYVRTIAAQLRRVVKGGYATYRRFEVALVAAATDLVLFVWALRSFVLLAVLEGTLVIAAVRWPIVWVLAFALIVLLVTAAVEVRRQGREENGEEPSVDKLRDSVYFMMLWILRGSLLVAGVTASLLVLLQRYSDEQLARHAQMYAQARRELPRWTTINIRNACRSATVAMAVHYRDSTNRWHTQGWFNLEPQARRDDFLHVRARRIYFYAESDNKEWSGAKGGPRIRRQIHDGKLSLTGNLHRKNVREVWFFGVDIGRDDEFTQVFDCSAGYSTAK